MTQESSVTAWIERVKLGDEQAAQKIWERYCVALAGLARKKLAGMPRREADEDDVLQEAFSAFFRAAQAGRLPLLSDRDDLWHLLVKITENKAFDQRKQQRRQKRGGGRVRGDSAFEASDGSAAGMDQAASPEPTPDFVAQAIEECGRLLAMLEDDQIRQIVLLKMEGYSREEIAQRLHCATETVARKLRLVRTAWSIESAGR